MDRPTRIVFKGKTYKLWGCYYRRNVWGSEGPSNLHRAIWEDAHGPIPDGYHVHHIDGNPFNNSVDNLQLVIAGEHVRNHTLQRIAEGQLSPPSKRALELAAEWHGSEEGLAWHTENGKRCWDKKEWHKITCRQCQREFMTPFPTRTKYCHLNCKMAALRIRRGAKPTRMPRVLGEITGKRLPDHSP